MKRSGEDTGVTVEFGTVLGYTKIVQKRKEVQKVQGGSKIQALSQGYKNGNQARVIINDKDVIKAGRGFNLVVLAGKDHEVIHAKTYDTYANGGAADAMAKVIGSVPMGSVIVAVVRDEGSRRLSQGAKDAFKQMGAKDIDKLGFREGYIFMGVKGSRQHLEKKGKSVQTGMILGYSRVTKREKHTRTITQTKSYKRSVRRVYRRVIKETRNGVTRTRIVTRVQRRTVSCKRTRKVQKTTWKVSSS